jgi:hypothetical protein
MLPLRSESLVPHLSNVKFQICKTNFYLLFFEVIHSITQRAGIAQSV